METLHQFMIDPATGQIIDTQRQVKTLSTTNDVDAYNHESTEIEFIEEIPSYLIPLILQ